MVSPKINIVSFVTLDLRNISYLWVFFAILTPHDLNVICTVNV